MKKSSKTKIKDKLWKFFSLYIRLRDSDSKGDGLCISCGRKYPYKQLQCGHFIPRTYQVWKYDERNNNSQCYGCNVMKSGNYVEYEAGMIKKYGKKIVDELKNGRNDLKNWKEYELEEMTEKYKQLSENEMKNKKVNL